MKTSTGLVKTQMFHFADPPQEMLLDSKQRLGPITLAYETYGALNKNKNNAILILHSLSGDAHVAGYHEEDESKPGWWDIMVGPNKPINTDRYFVVCSNIIGGCMGSTGPQSLDPKTGKPFGMTFPMITVSDMVHAQKALIDYLGIERLLCVCGGSLGGMQALQWPIHYPDVVHAAIPIATTSRLSAQSLSFNAVGRNAILSDPQWHHGKYYAKNVIPKKGLAIARMIGHITYLSPESMHDKFGRRLQERETYGYDFGTDFQVESYLQYQGSRFVERFDANTYLYLTKAMDYFDLGDRYGSLEQAFANLKTKFLVISFSSDWLFPTSQSKEIVKAMIHNQMDVSFCEIETPFGHDAFLIENETFAKLVHHFLDNLSF